MSGVIVGIVGTVIGAGISIAQGVSAKRKQKAAELQADRLLQETKDQIDVNPYEELDVNLMASERSRDLLRAGVAQQGLGSFDQRQPPGQRALDALMKGEMAIQNKEIDRLEKIEKAIADRDTDIADTTASVLTAQTKQMNEQAAATGAAADAAFAQAGITASLGAANAIAGMQRSDFKQNQQLRRLDKASGEGGLSGLATEYAAGLKDARGGQAIPNLTATQNYQGKGINPAFQTGLDEAFAANPTFQQEFIETYKAGIPTSDQLSDLFGKYLQPEQIEGLYTKGYYSN